MNVICHNCGYLKQPHPASFCDCGATPRIAAAESDALADAIRERDAAVGLWKNTVCFLRDIKPLHNQDNRQRIDGLFEAHRDFLARIDAKGGGK